MKKNAVSVEVKDIAIIANTVKKINIYVQNAIMKS